MKIIVLIKQVPDPAHFSRITIDPETGMLRREGVPLIMNPNDKNAVEEALRIKEMTGGRVVAISMGPPKARSSVEEALGMGCDEGVLLSDPSFAGSDTIATAITLSCAIRRLGDFDLILTGNFTIDSGTGSLPPQLAEFLGIPHMTSVSEIKLLDGKVRATMRGERGYIKAVLPMPCLLAVRDDINTPRIPSVLEIVKLPEKPLHIWGREDIGIDERLTGIKGSPTRVERMTKMRRERRGEVLSLPPREAARRIASELRSKGII